MVQKKAQLILHAHPLYEKYRRVKHSVQFFSTTKFYVCKESMFKKQFSKFYGPQTRYA